ncbi:MAG TPA: alanine racemase [Solirubrobacteraceae bacterium]|nr:alanine racemase [Solirubrobacteraceae bacterium]
MSDQRRALARVNLAAIERNCARLRSELADGCELCAVVKADGYGHGAVQSALAALAGGATQLAVAGAHEAVLLRAAGLYEVPVLVMGALSEIELGEALEAQAEVVIWSAAGLDAVVRAGGGRVHVKLDSGMGRLGTRDPDQASEVVELAAATEGVELVGAMTHFATADDRADDFFERQLELFDRWAQEVKAEYGDVVMHAANSAAVLRDRRAHFDMVRCGIAIYGMDPFGEDPGAVGLEPALELISYVAEVKRCAPGQSAGYGRRFIAHTDTHLGVLPIGYGDGWRRGLSGEADVLVQGTRRPLVGTVSMDNLTIDLGDDHDAASLCGSEAVLLGAQGEQRIFAEEVARRLHTINYEIGCALTARVPRFFHRDGLPAQPDEQRPA